MKKIQDTITKIKLNNYRTITKKAFEIARKNIVKTKSKKRQLQVKEILQMVECYINDSEFFEKKQDYVNAFAALNYSHGWLDAGARLGYFNVKDKDPNSEFFAV